MKKFSGVDSRGMSCFPWQIVVSKLPLIAQTIESKLINLDFSVNSPTEIAEIRRNAADVVYGVLRIEHNGKILEEWIFRDATFLPWYEVFSDGRILRMTLNSNKVEWVPHRRKSHRRKSQKVILFEDQDSL